MLLDSEPGESVEPPHQICAMRSQRFKSALPSAPTPPPPLRERGRVFGDADRFSLSRDGDEFGARKLSTSHRQKSCVGMHNTGQGVF